MSGVSFTYDDSEADEALRKVEAVGGDVSRVLAAFKNIMLSGVQQRFQTETGPNGRAWQRLSPRTAKARRGRGRRGFDNILRVTGKLFTSIIGTADADKAQVGSNYKTAAVHQEGATINRQARQAKIRLRKVKGRTRFASRRHKRAEDRNVTIKAHTIEIPARPYLGFDPDMIAELNKAAELEIARATGAEIAP